MSGISPVRIYSTRAGYSEINTGRSNTDNSHDYISSRINDLYKQALTRQQSFSGTRSLRRFIDSKGPDGNKLNQFG